MGHARTSPPKERTPFSHLAPPTHQKETQHPTGLFRVLKQRIPHLVNTTPPHFTECHGRLPQRWEAPKAGESLRQCQAAVHALPPLGSCDSAAALITDASVVGKDTRSLWQAQQENDNRGPWSSGPRPCHLRQNSTHCSRNSLSIPLDLDRARAPTRSA